MKYIKDRKKLLTTILVSLFPLAILVLLPYNLTREQGVVLSAVIFAVSLWATKLVDTKISSIFLILVFLFVVGAPAQEVFKFPMSNTFVLLVSCTLISEAMINSGLSSRITSNFLDKYGTTGPKLVALPFIIDFILIFFIPQPFPRVILLSAVYRQFLGDRGVNRDALHVFLFAIFVASTGTSMFFLSGDVLLNSLALEFAGVSLTWIEWAIYMAIPSIFICIMLYTAFYITFRREIAGIELSENSSREVGSKPLSLVEKKITPIIIVITLLWMTEPLHGISSAWVSTLGVIAMFSFKLLTKKDLKKVNMDLIVFLTAAFSIGGVLNYSGTAQILYEQIMEQMPSQQSYLYFPFIVLMIMAIHMIVGSSITTLATVVPGLIIMNNSFVNPAAVALLAYTCVNIHYLLPFHHVTIMLGAGESFTKANTSSSLE